MYKTGRCQEDLKSLIYEIICGLNLKVIYSGIIKKIWSAILCFQYYRRYTCLLQNSVIKQICEKKHKQRQNFYFWGYVRWWGGEWLGRGRLIIKFLIFVKVIFINFFLSSSFTTQHGNTCTTLREYYRLYLSLTKYTECISTGCSTKIFAAFVRQPTFA